MPVADKRSLMISGGWIQTAAIVLIIGFLIMGILTYYTYSDEPPIPEVVKSTNGTILFTRADVVEAQAYSCRKWAYGIWVDFWPWCVSWTGFHTAENLHRTALFEHWLLRKIGLGYRRELRLFRISRRTVMTRAPASSSTPTRKRRRSRSAVCLLRFVLRGTYYEVPAEAQRNS